MTNVVEFPERDGPPDMRGPDRFGCDVIIDGRLVPNMHMHDKGDEILFVIDGRFQFGFPREWAHHAASMAAEAMAIGAGYPSFRADKKDRPFASIVHKIEFAD
jgi:uncharacterized RmlC-like cupin family protein